jgi:pimeloyl-ACP methyl ester carboxylesterase
MICNHLGFTWTHLSKNPIYAHKVFLHPSQPVDEVLRITDLLGDEAALAYFQMFGPLLFKGRKVDCPTLVIGAELDQIFKPYEVKATARLLGAQCEIMPDTAHDIMLDPNWAKAADLMLEWLRENRLGTESGT